MTVLTTSVDAGAATDVAKALLAIGVPVVVCKPTPGWTPGSARADVIPPPGWALITADECDISRYREGIDTLAMVAGHVADIVDQDIPGTIDNLPPFRSFGRVRTPSGGHHYYVRSTGIGKLSPLRTSAGHVGDYVGGTRQGGSRMLAFLPGSTRPKYPGAGYTVEVPLDLAALVEHGPDDELVSALLACGGSKAGDPGKPAAVWAEVRAFLRDRSEVPVPCNYGRKAIANLIASADATVPHDPKRGRHGWAVASATRTVELIRDGCASAADLDELERMLDRIKPEGGTDWHGCIAWGLSNADGRSECGLHNPQPVVDGEGHDQAGDADAAVEATLDQAATFARDVDQEAHRLRVREAARAKVTLENTPPAPPFDAGLLTEVLARPAGPPDRIEGLMPSEGGMLVVAQRKTGKTTYKLNLARSLILGGDFLGRFPVRPITGRVGFLNFEVSAAQLGRWADEARVPRERLYLVNLRGRRNPFGNDDDRALLAEQLREHEVESLTVDPFGRAYTGKSQNDPGEVGAWLADLDRWARADAGVVDIILSAHAGWNGERTRGASALEDWADSVVTLVRDPDDDQLRFLKAEGRDVLVDEDRLDYDATTRTLRLAGAGSRKTAAKVRHVDELVAPVVKVATADPGITGYKLERALRDAGATFQRGDEIKAARLAVQRGLLVVTDGPRNSKQ